VISAKRLKEVLERSVVDANQHYEMLTGGEWMSERGVESVMAYHVGKAIKEALPNSHFVIPEGTIKQIENGSTNAPLKGRRSNHLKKGNRIDIVLTNNSYTPFGVIELKRDRFTYNWKRDADRVVYLMRAFDCIKIGAFAVFIGEEERKSRKSFIDDNMPDVTAYLDALKDDFCDRDIRHIQLDHVASGVRRMSSGRPLKGSHRYAVAGFVLQKR
jgi:hypothetical protein